MGGLGIEALPNGIQHGFGSSGMRLGAQDDVVHGVIVSYAYVYDCVEPSPFVVGCLLEGYI